MLSLVFTGKISIVIVCNLKTSWSSHDRNTRMQFRTVTRQQETRVLKPTFWKFLSPAEGNQSKNMYQWNVDELSHD